MFRPAQHFLETRAVTLVGFVFLHGCYGDRASVVWAAGRVRGTRERAPGDRVAHLAGRCRPLPRAAQGPGQGPAFPPVTQRGPRRCHLLLRNTTHTSAGPLRTLAPAGATLRAAARAPRAPLHFGARGASESRHCGAVPPDGAFPPAGREPTGRAEALGLGWGTLALGRSVELSSKLRTEDDGEVIYLEVNC